MKARRAALIVSGVTVAGVVVVFPYLYRKHLTTEARPHSVTLTWHPSAGAISYNVYRSTASGVRGLKIGTSNVPTYIDTPVPSGATFYYTVTAVGNGRESGPSNEAKAVVP